MLLPLRFTGIAQLTLAEVVPGCKACEGTPALANLPSADMQVGSGTATKDDVVVQGRRSDRNVEFNGPGVAALCSLSNSDKAMPRLELLTAPDHCLTWVRSAVRTPPCAGGGITTSD